MSIGTGRQSEQSAQVVWHLLGGQAQASPRDCRGRLSADCLAEERSRVVEEGGCQRATSACRQAAPNHAQALARVLARCRCEGWHALRRLYASGPEGLLGVLAAPLNKTRPGPLPVCARPRGCRRPSLPVRRLRERVVRRSFVSPRYYSSSLYLRCCEVAWSCPTRGESVAASSTVAVDYQRPAPKYHSTITAA